MPITPTPPVPQDVGAADRTIDDPALLRTFLFGLAEGMTASAERFADAIVEMCANWQHYDPRRVVLENWTWRQSVERLLSAISLHCNLKQGHAALASLTRRVDRPTELRDIGQ